MGIKKTYNCIQCGISVTKDNTAGKFCSNKCSGAHKKAQTFLEIESGLVENRDARTLKAFLAERDGDSCSSCGIGSEWNSRPLTLQLDHIDGNSDNNELSNLRILCPNCHSQTETYGAKGNGNRYKKVTKRNSYLQKYKASLV
jgi:endogenous inhibitor of DNA gyrase (YacG/DUF329 family)